MADYSAKVYMKQGGDEQIVESGGTITVKSGGSLVLETGASFTKGAGVLETDVLAEGAVLPAPMQIHIIDVPDAATGDVDVVFTQKERIVQIEVIKGASAGGTDDTITVKKGSTAITNAMSIDVAAKTVVRPTTFDTAQWEIAAAGTLKITRTKVSAANTACKVILHTVLVA